MVSTHGTEDTKKRFLERLCSMELFASCECTDSLGSAAQVALTTRMREPLCRLPDRA